MSSLDFSAPNLLINRELSLLEFNRRVLAQALDDSVPLLERLRFLCIASANLDEFFEIRVAGLKQQAAYAWAHRSDDGLTPDEQLAAISVTARELVDEQYRVLNEVLLPLLDAQGMGIRSGSQWTLKQAQWLKRYFNRELLPMLSPMGLDPAHPFPRILNKSLNFIVTLEGKDAFGRSGGKAIVQAPRALPRVIELPGTNAKSERDFVLLSSIIEAYVGDLFPGMTATGCYQFRVTRNSDLFVDDEEVDDLLRAMEGELEQRHLGDAVRLELAVGAPVSVVSYLTERFGLASDDVYHCRGPVNLARMTAIADQVQRDDLKFYPFTPSVPAQVRGESDIFATLRERDVLLHHPFESFSPVVEFLRQAAADEQVLAIRQTLYRTGADSAVVQALIAAAQARKEVTVVVELRARFDEEANIGLATQLQEAGCHVVYGVVGHKTHAKMSLIVRREGRSLRRYVHLGTGNYHARTARLYTDYGLMTCDPALCEDAQKVFQQLMALGRAGRLKKVLQSPFTLHRSMLDLIQAEIDLARAGRPARIVAKMNSLIEPEIIRALYRASNAGVRIDLIVRGICAVRPGMPGVSQNITVRSIIGRFLEHTRVFYFGNGAVTSGSRLLPRPAAAEKRGKSTQRGGPRGQASPMPRVYLSSADWMGRNFFHRIETCFPIEDPELLQRVVSESLENYLADNVQAWLLDQHGTYRRAKSSGARRRSAQSMLLETLVVDPVTSAG